MNKFKELMENWEKFAQMIQEPLPLHDELSAAMLKLYSEQNIEILNEVLLSSLDHLQRLRKAKSLNDVICTQARLSDEIGKKMMKGAQKFFNASLNNVTDYNEWLKRHCDFATD